jgi:adenylate kinase
LYNEQATEQLKDLFGNYRAEWLRNRIFELFTKPAYFPDLETRGPCVLIGGRGTGKTTVLRTLSYEGKFALSNQDVTSIGTWPYYGFYYRVDTNHVRAFSGPELPDETWIKIFAHYVNLLLCGEVMQFLKWYNQHRPLDPVLPERACHRVAISLHLGDVTTFPQLLLNLEEVKIHFEAFLNNLSADRLPLLSLQAAPIKELIDRVTELPQFADKYFFFLIDEYENLSDIQQTVFNTLIKHSGEKYSFKIGVKELGLRIRATLNPHEQLVSPADYVRVNIPEKLSGAIFEKFALDICNQRIARLNIDTHRSVASVASLFPGLTDEQEAELLGIKDVIKAEIKKSSYRQLSIDDIPSLELYFCLFWARAHHLDLRDVLEERRRNIRAWRTRFANYKYALLFTIRRGLPGIRKYFCGWRAFIQLSNSNIRYLLELVEQTLFLFLQREEGQFGEPIPPETQTRAAESVGKKNVGELEGLAVSGAQLTKLVLGLGRIFEVMARQLEGHAPEVTQFAIDDSAATSTEFEDLMNSAVMHLALVRASTTKRRGNDPADIRSYDYSLHPIFAPFFLYSYRKKRKIKLSQDHILGLVSPDGNSMISTILRDHGRADKDQPLPEQLMLFGRYYGIHS